MRVGVLAAALVLTSLPASWASNGIKKPKDGGGIKWSSLRPCLVFEIPLKNGGSVKRQETTKFNGDFAAAVYKVDLIVDGEVVKTIRVAVSTKDPPPNFPEDGNWEDYTYHCHGFVFGESIYNPFGVGVPHILKAGWDEIDCADLKKGDIIVYYASGVDPKAPAGAVTHSAVANGDGTFATKNGAKPFKARATRAELDAEYGGRLGTAKCYRRKD